MCWGVFRQKEGEFLRGKGKDCKVEKPARAVSKFLTKGGVKKCEIGSETNRIIFFWF
jgi:hypothetical protein